MDWLFLVLWLGSAIWVAFDSRQLGVRGGMLGGGMSDMGPAGWFLSVLGIWIVGFPAYLATRPRYVRMMQERNTYTPPPATIAAGWLSDPMGRHQLRYYDGIGWTDHVADNGVQTTDPTVHGIDSYKPPLPFGG